MNRLLRHLFFGVMAAAAGTAVAGVTLFESDNFGGSQIRLDRSVANFAAIGFSNRARSAIVEGDAWDVCADVNYGGGCTRLAPGRYPSLGGWSNLISSARSFSAPVAVQSPTVAIGTPRIEGFDVAPARSLSAGNQMAFTLYGTPGGAASVRIGAMPTRILLDEVEAGVYERTYIIRSGDRIDANTAATANLRLGNKIAAATLDESLLAGAPSPSDRAAAAAAATPRIDRFEVDPPARLAPGEQIYFSLRGTPAGKASVHIVGVKGRLLLEEAQGGIYQGAYTIKERDRIAADAKVTARLKIGKRDVRAVLNQSLLAVAGTQPSARRATRYCAYCGVVEAINMVEVKGDGGYVGKIAGGVIGGLLGSQVGQGRGTTAAQIAGVVGGAVIGNEIEKRRNTTVHYDVVTRLQGGGAQTVTYATEPPFKVGDQVRVENGVLVANQ